MSSARGKLIAISIVVLIGLFAAFAGTNATAQDETVGGPRAGIRQAPAAGQEKVTEPGLEAEEAAELRQRLPLFGARVFEADEVSFAPPINVPVPDSYVLGPGDTLAVRVWGAGVQYHDIVAVVTQEGNVALELLGDFSVGGLSVAEARAAIGAAYQKFYPRAEFSVSVAELRSIEVFVIGDVERPGKHLLPSMATVFSALYAAGGPTEAGTLRRIRLIRDGQPVGTLDVYEYLLEGIVAGDERLNSGDTVFVPVIGDVVAIAGEVKRPARYELLPGTTLAEALQIAGGLRATGYVQRLQITRVEGNRKRTVLDADLANEPDKWSGLPLTDGDEITVLPVREEIENIVFIEGEVERPGQYELMPEMRVSQLIERAEGITERASRDTGHILRKSPLGLREMLPFAVAKAVAGAEGDNPRLQPGDIVHIYDINEVALPARVTIVGAVANAGGYDFYHGMRVSDLVARAGGVRPRAYGGIAHLLRQTASLEPELISVDLAAALRREPAADLELHSQDRLMVYTRAQMAPELKIRVSGAVLLPGEFGLAKNMRVSDALTLAGGLLPEASGTAALIHGQTTGLAEMETIDLSAMTDGGAPVPNPVLQDGDEIGVFGIGGYKRKAEVVQIRGQVVQPGTYPLRVDAEARPMRVSELVATAGGALDSAYLEAATVYHSEDTMQMAEARAQLVKQGLEDVASAEPIPTGAELQPTGEVEEEKPTEQVQEAVAGQAPQEAGPAGEGEKAEGQKKADTVYQQSISLGQGRSKQATQRIVQVLVGEMGEALIIVPPRDLTDVAVSSAIPLNLARALAHPNSRHNLELQPGDILAIPERPSTVIVAGAVASPGPLPYRKGWKLEGYLKASGGCTADADLKHVAVVKYNGRAQNIKLVKTIDPGDYIIVPTRYSARTVGGRPAWERALNNLAEIATTLWLFRRK